MSSLDWGLVIATKDRFDPLKTCVSLALAQTREPTEVVIVDSSADWKNHKLKVQEIVDQKPNVRFTYLQGDAPSLTVQRNQAAAAASADILFMIDDDSYMFSDCAERIMNIYEADEAAVLAGVQAMDTNLSPLHVKDGSAQEKQEIAFANLRRSSPLVRGILRKVLMASKEEIFIPYDGHYPTWDLPDAVADLPCRPETMFGGFRMTYRRSAVLSEPFDPTLRYYCPGEDLDGSYRISRKGALVTATEAKLFHFSSAAGRLNRTQVAHLWSLNQAVLLRRHAPDQHWARRVYRRKMIRRLTTDFVKDLLMLRFGFPQTKGSWRAWRDSQQAMRLSPEDLSDWYPRRQADIVGAK
ncbi:Glycosyltransferase, GT2 family [Cognatiyoonia sediminum]|uniref:Glycosyltransferase, GT2 family n=1 Tax=Cognatiyoonia sediminum TaxID=1508389 RepID=A0A1M5QVT5_9RHOB|nr:glycosyltransferase family 2 protein [Cognatiyoonia sediminum]SHH18212.1 Glycosyltransferase, GT2 family [Cognatiyoonia sediminum]